MKKVGIIILFLAGSFVLFAGGKKDQDLPLLVDSLTLEKSLNNEGLVLVDFGRKVEDYQAGHIPGAVYFPREKVWTEVNGTPGMFPGVDAAVLAIEEAGISNDSTVLIYDGIGGLWASRLFWTLEYLGHQDVHILDGGIQAWEEAGFSLSTDSVELSKGSFQGVVQEQLLVDSQQILENLNGENQLVIDTRSQGEYLGEDLRAAQGGHIPGALSINWVNNVTDDEEKYFLSEEELGEFYEAKGVHKENSVVTLCQTGVRGAHTYFVLRLLGYQEVALYDGSWADWGNNPDLPISREVQ